MEGMAQGEARGRQRAQVPWEMWASGAALAGGYCKMGGGCQHTDKGMHVHHVHLHMYPS